LALSLRTALLALGHFTFSRALQLASLVVGTVSMQTPPPIFVQPAILVVLLAQEEQLRLVLHALYLYISNHQLSNA